MDLKCFQIRFGPNPWTLPCQLERFATHRRAASPRARKTNAHIRPNAKPAVPSANVSTHTPYQPTKAIPLTDMVLPPRTLKVPAANPSTNPPTVHHLMTGQAARRQGLPFSISGMSVSPSYAFSTRPYASRTLSFIISERVGCGKTECISSSSVVSRFMAITKPWMSSVTSAPTI